MNISLGFELFHYLRSKVGRGNISAWVRDACEQKRLKEEAFKRK